MSINFFEVKCQTKIHRQQFGICDPPSSSENPACLDIENPSRWIAMVENSQEIEVTFTAIDNCIEIRKVDGSGGMDKRCDGMLTYSNLGASPFCTLAILKGTATLSIALLWGTILRKWGVLSNCLIFVELKERAVANSVWVKKGEEQLRNTIRIFLENYSIDDYLSKRAYIANNKKPKFQTSQTERMEKFRRETGFRLIIQNTIQIE